MWSGLSPGARQQFTYPDPGRDRETSSEDDFKKVRLRTSLYRSIICNFCSLRSWFRLE